MVTLHIGFDDTDSLKGGCTTYIAALLVEKFSELDVKFCDYPNLIRLNPNVPWKTRGNGALCLRISCEDSVTDEIYEIVSDTVEENSELTSTNTDPGIVFFKGNKIPFKIRKFAKATIQSVVKMEEALRIIKEFTAEALGYGTGYGIVGALAAIGETLTEDHTYEVIAYRTPENRGSKRRVDLDSIRKMNKETENQTFNNLDPETDRVLITPRGPDPILYGIRGETAEAVVTAHRMVKQLEPVERWVVFRTNQGTDAHLRRISRVTDIQPFQPICFEGTVTSSPKLIPKRHRVFSVKDETGKVDCAVYEPTGVLRKAAKELLMGDRLEACGGVRPGSLEHPLTVNLEKFKIFELAPKLEIRNPICPECNKRMCSMGASQGFRCKKCDYQSRSIQKTFIEQKRVIKKGLYITSPRSQRHLTKPLIRYGREKTSNIEEMITKWHYHNPQRIEV